jgi:hypothetical protein
MSPLHDSASCATLPLLHRAHSRGELVSRGTAQNVHPLHVACDFHELKTGHDSMILVPGDVAAILLQSAKESSGKGPP